MYRTNSHSARSNSWIVVIALAAVLPLLAGPLAMAASTSGKAKERSAVKQTPKGRVAVEAIVIDPHRPPSSSGAANIWTDERTYYQKDRIRIRFTVTRDSYVYIFNTDTEGVTRQIFPNYYDRNPAVHPGGSATFPTLSRRGDGEFSTSASGPAGRQPRPPVS